MNSPENLTAINKILTDAKNIMYRECRKQGKRYFQIHKDIRRYHSYIFTGTGQKRGMRHFISLQPQYKVAATIHDKSYHRQAIPFTDWPTAMNNYMHEAYHKRYFYEIILSDRPCKPYLDLEKTVDFQCFGHDFSDIIHKIQNDITQIFCNRYNINITNDMTMITQSHRENKISFHVVLNIIINNQYYAYQTNTKKQNNSAYDLYLALIEKDPSWKDYTDSSVYSIDRDFRAIYSTKPNDVHQFEPINNNPSIKFVPNWLDYFVTHFDPQYPIQIIQTPKIINEITQKKIRQSHKLYNLPGNHLTEFANGEERQLIERLQELATIIHPSAYFTNTTQDDRGYRFSYYDRTEPCYTGREHSTNGFNIYVKSHNGDVYAFCLSPHCQKLFKLGNLHYDETWKNEATTINQQYLQYFPTIAITPTPENYTLTGFINDFLQKGGAYAIKSNMGTGKTQLLKTIISLNFTDKRIIYLSHRQTFTHNIHGSFKSLGFANYLEENRNTLGNHDKIILQIDSLIKIFDEDNTITPYDFIILDEIESLLAHMSSNTLSNKRNKICIIINALLQGAKWILALDADYNHRAQEFLLQTVGKPKLIINQHISSKKKFLFTKNYEKRIIQLIEDLKNNKNIVVICLSKNTLDEIYQKIETTLPDTKAKIYTSMTDDCEKELLTNANELWRNFQLIMYSPTIEAGLDFNEPHFHKIYCFLNNGSCSPRALLQMIGRIRSLEDPNILCFYEKTMKYYSVGHTIYIPHVDETEELLLKHDASLPNETITLDDNGKLRLTVTKNPFTRVFAHNFIENYEKRVGFMPKFKEILAEKEHDYLNEDEIIEETNTTELADSVEQPNLNPFDCSETTGTSASKSTVHMDDLLAAPFINEFDRVDLEKLQKQNKLDKLGKLALQKYYLVRDFKLTPERFDLPFLINWYGKDHIRKNALFAMGKLKVDITQDPILNKLPQKLQYLKLFLNTYGFTGLLDEQTITKTPEMVAKMQATGLSNFDKYKELMTVFEKPIQRSENNVFSIAKFSKLADMVLQEFGFTLKSNRTQIRSDGARTYQTYYTISEYREGIKNIINYDNLI